MTETTCWIIGHKVTLATNNSSHIGEPFIVFPTEAAALSACDMVEKVSGERPMMVEASFYRRPPQAGPADGGRARAAVLSPERRSGIASKAAQARWHGPGTKD